MFTLLKISDFRALFSEQTSTEKHAAGDSSSNNENTVNYPENYHARYLLSCQVIYQCEVTHNRQHKNFPSFVVQLAGSPNEDLLCLLTDCLGLIQQGRSSQELSAGFEQNLVHEHLYHIPVRQEPTIPCKIVETTICEQKNTVTGRKSS